MTRTMKITTHDLHSALIGHPIMCSFDDGAEALLRLDGTPVKPECLADHRALDDDLPIVSISREEAGTIAHGGTALVQVANRPGEVVQVRYMTPDELLEVHAAACAKYGTEPNLTRARAEDLTRAL